VKKLVGALGASVLLFLLVAVGAGGATTAKGAAAGPGNAPAAKESIGQFAARFKTAAHAAVTGKCKTVDAFNVLNLVAFPCGGAGGKSYADLKVTGTATFGTGAVVDYTDRQAPDGATLLLGLDESGKYGVLISLISNKDEVGTKPRHAAAAERGVKNFIRAVREEDCDAYFEQAFTFSQNKAKECKAEFASPTPGEFQADPTAKPTRFGGTADFVFFGLSTGTDGYRTIVTLPGSSPSKVVVLSYSARPLG
jgi:hypothetical protein